MGQAKKRGSFEERKAAAIVRMQEFRRQEDEKLDKERAEGLPRRKAPPMAVAMFMAAGLSANL